MAIWTGVTDTAELLDDSRTLNCSVSSTRLSLMMVIGTVTRLFPEKATGELERDT